MPVTFESLRLSGLLEREAWYLSIPGQLALPLDRVRLGASTVPAGWALEEKRGSRAVRARMVAAEKEFYQELLARAWDRDPVPEKVLSREVWAGAEKSGWEARFREWKSLRKLRAPFGRRFLGGDYLTLARRLRVDYSLVSQFSSKPRAKRVWVRQGLGRSEDEDGWRGLCHIWDLPVPDGFGREYVDLLLGREGVPRD